MVNGDGVKLLDPRNSADIENAVRLHCELLPDSPLSQLGQGFMRRFYYGKLVEDGLVCCTLYCHQNKPAGFIAYTKYSSTFMAQGLRRHWLSLAAVLAGSILCRPRRLGVIFQILMVMYGRKSEKGHAVVGEILSFGVIPECRSRAFLSRTGHRISFELFECAKEYFRSEKVPNFRGVLNARNREALLFYHAQGCQFQRDPGGNEKTIQIIYTFEA